MSDENETDVMPEELPEVKFGSQDIVDDRQRIKDAVEALGDDLDPEKVREITSGVAVYDSNNFPTSDKGEADSPTKPSQLPKDVYEVDSPKGKGR